MKLRDLPELGYLTTDNPPRGEILVKGNSVFKGYFRNPALTSEVLDADGWLRLGDVGVLLPGGCLKLIDRVSSIQKLQPGFYVAPQYLENIFGQCQSVSQVFVSADPRSEFVAAVIVPEREYLLRKLSESSGGLPLEQYQKMTSIEYQALLDENENVRKILQAELLAKENEFQLADYERIAAHTRFYLSSLPFVAGNHSSGEDQEEEKEESAPRTGFPILTNTMKLKRVDYD